MLKKIAVWTLCMALCFLTAACGGTGKKKMVSLDEDEKEMLELIGEDIHTITDEDYAQTVSEFIYHADEFSGQVYQLEGLYTVKDDISSITRTLVDGDEKTVCSLPLKYVQKDIDADSWVKVTGIVSADKVNGENRTVLEVVAIETMPEDGQAELQWDSSLGHQH